MDKPLVSVICTAYNHERYIERCIVGFLNQKTNFIFEVLINDDASTDRTAEIIRKYERAYPDIIKPIYQNENQYSKRTGLWRSILFPRANGKYIAICEGDDYWTDPLKLQKQVDFLETHPEYILVCGGYRAESDVDNYEEVLTSVVPRHQENEKGFTFTLKDLSKTWLTKTLTSLFRKMPDLTEYSVKYKFSRDVHLFHYLLKQGKGYYMKEVLGVYNKHAGGVSSLKSREDQLLIHYDIYQDMYAKSPDEFTRSKYLQVCLDLLNLKLSGMVKKRKVKSVTLLAVFFRLVRSYSEIIYFMKSLIPWQLKIFIHDGVNQSTR